MKEIEEVQWHGLERNAHLTGDWIPHALPKRDPAGNPLRCCIPARAAPIQHQDPWVLRNWCPCIES